MNHDNPEPDRSLVRFVAEAMARQENIRTWAAVGFTGMAILATAAISIFLIIRGYPWPASIGGFPILGIVALFLRITSANRKVYSEMITPQSGTQVAPTILDADKRKNGAKSKKSSQPLPLRSEADAEI